MSIKSSRTRTCTEITFKIRKAIALKVNIVFVSHFIWGTQENEILKGFFVLSLFRFDSDQFTFFFFLIKHPWGHEKVEREKYFTIKAFFSSLISSGGNLFNEGIPKKINWTISLKRFWAHEDSFSAYVIESGTNWKFNKNPICNERSFDCWSGKIFTIFKSFSWNLRKFATVLREKFTKIGIFWFLFSLLPFIKTL